MSSNKSLLERLWLSALDGAKSVSTPLADADVEARLLQVRNCPRAELVGRKEHIKDTAAAARKVALPCRGHRWSDLPSRRGKVD